MATQTDQERMKAGELQAPPSMGGMQANVPEGRLGITSTSDRPTQTDGLTPIFLIPPLDKSWIAPLQNLTESEALIVSLAE
eukprot:955589-Pelagomonas_calceolata.AAC.2